MHELSIAAAIVDTAVAHAGGRRVSVVSVRIGHLRQAIPDSLRFSFGICTRETLCEGAELALEVVPGRLACRDCGWAWDADAHAFRCPSCASADVDVIAGEELEVESIEVEAEPCTV